MNHLGSPFLRLIGLVFLFSCKPGPLVPTDERLYVPTTTLKAQADYRVGVAIQSGKLSDTAFADLITKEFSSLTAENQMKQGIMMPASGVFDFSEGDVIVDFAQANGLRVHGHALIWHSSLPIWFDTYSGTNAQFEQITKTYIQTTVTHFKGRVASWDVVNEAFDDDSRQLRNSIFRQKMGDDYVEKCFQWAHEADPDALLFYNDYGLEYDDKKRSAVVDMINDFKARNIPIHGFGFQMHINHNWPGKGTLSNAVNTLAATGLQIHFSEIDVRANPNNDLAELTLNRAKSQEDRYREIAALFKTIPVSQQFGMTFWGLTDNESWLIPFWGNIDWPLLFDANKGYKIAHRGMIEGM